MKKFLSSLSSGDKIQLVRLVVDILILITTICK